VTILFVILATLAVIGAFGFAPQIWGWLSGLLRRVLFREATADERAQEARERGWDALETDHAAECLAALTPEDVEWLRWWGWEPSEDVERRVTRAALERRYREAQERMDKAKAAKAARARAAGKRTQEELAAEADARVQKGQIHSTATVARMALEAEAYSAQEERARQSLEHYLGIRSYSTGGPVPAAQRVEKRRTVTAGGYYEDIVANGRVISRRYV
jgi:hypothetical protein